MPLLAIAAGATKLTVMGLNHIGSHKFEIDNKKQLSKKELARAKRKRNKAIFKSVFKNFTTGALNGLLAPVATIAGGIVGVPAYLLANATTRYALSSSNKGQKSAHNFMDTIKDNAGITAVFALALGLPALKKAHYTKVLDENLAKVVKKLKDVKLEPPKFDSQKSAYQELEDIMLESPAISSIRRNSTLSIEDQIHRLTDENIFAVKFLQINNSGALSSALKESCPASRTMAEAQTHINGLLSGTEHQYTVTKLLGVGTIAESYLAKDKSGKEVCIKILKKGIDADKIKRDKEAFVKLIMGDTHPDKLSENQKYLLRNLDNLAEGVSKEVDFENEAKAADKLRKFTKKADVVVPIQAKPGIYIMEKAPGISLENLTRYYTAQAQLKLINYPPEKAKLEAEIKAIKAKSPDFEDFELSTNQVEKLLTNYMDVLIEQFSKIEKDGKTLHADIHPGNIFINLDVVKGAKKGKLFTLIDTGNTIDLTQEQSKRFIQYSSFISNGNVKDITSFVLDGAVLPPGLKPDKASELVSKDLHEIFFDAKTGIEMMNIETMLNLTNNVLRKHQIIPNDTQMNLNKARKSSFNSLNGLINSFFSKKYVVEGDLANQSGTDKMQTGMTMIKDAVVLLAKYKSKQKAQEGQNIYNFFMQSPKEAWNHVSNPNNIPTNGEDHLTYTLKQFMFESAMQESHKKK